MKPTKFKEQNFTFEPPKKKGANKVEPLPCYLDSQAHQVVSCWKLTFWERIKVLFTGKMWMGIESSPPPPLWIGAKYPFRLSIGQYPFFNTPFMQKIKNLFAPRCGSCKHHSGDTICHKLGGIVSTQNPVADCGSYKKRVVRKKEEKK